MRRALSVFSATPSPLFPYLFTSLPHHFRLVVPPYRYVASTYLLCLPLLRKLPGVYPKFPNWKTTPRLPLARLPLLLPSTPAAPRPPKILPEAGSHKWKPSSSHQSRRDTPVVSARSAGAPSRPHRF